MNFTDEQKAVREFNDSNYFSFGVHHVRISAVVLDITAKDQEYIEFTVVGEHNEEDTVRVWFTTDKAINYSFNILRQIYIHIAPESKKEEARLEFEHVTSTEQLAALMQKCVGGDCWYTKYLDLDRKYVAANGETRNSTNKSIYGYEPKLRPELLPTDKAASAATAEEKRQDDINTPVNIPSDWA